MSLAPATVARRAIVKILRTGFLGTAFDEKDFCPLAVPGTKFDETIDASVSPFTAAEVLDTVGHGAIYVTDVSETDDRTTSGVNETGVMVSSELTRMRVRTVFSVPKSSEQAERVERYTDQVSNVLRGVAWQSVGTPDVKLTQLATDPALPIFDDDSGNFRRRALDFFVERRYQRPHAGLSGVTLT